MGWALESIRREAERDPRLAQAIAEAGGPASWALAPPPVAGQGRIGPYDALVGLGQLPFIGGMAPLPPRLRGVGRPPPLSEEGPEFWRAIKARVARAMVGEEEFAKKLGVEPPPLREADPEILRQLGSEQRTVPHGGHIDVPGVTSAAGERAPRIGGWLELPVEERGLTLPDQLERLRQQRWRDLPPREAGTDPELMRGLQEALDESFRVRPPGARAQRTVQIYGRERIPAEDVAIWLSQAPEGHVRVPVYGGRLGYGEFKPMTPYEARALQSGETLWFRADDGSARQIRVNGRVRTWVRDPLRVEIPYKYGLREYGTLTRRDIEAGRLLSLVE